MEQRPVSSDASSLSAGTGTLSSTLPPGRQRGNALQRDVYAAGLLVVGLASWRVITTKDVCHGPRSASGWPLRRPAHPDFHAVLASSLELVPRNRPSAAKLLELLPPAENWFGVLAKSEGSSGGMTL